MKNYAEMSDFEINCAITKALGMSHAFFFSKSEDDFCEGIEPKERGPIWQSGKYEVNGYRVSNGNCFNPCNSWADAGPVIQSNQISLDAIYEGVPRWLSFAGDDCEFRYTDANPLRAAMIVFLMVHENDKP